MHYQIEQAGQALRFQAIAGQLPMSQYLADLFYADTIDSIPVITVERPARVPAGHRSPGRIRRAVRVARALGGLTMKRSPKWARTLAVACLAIPGPFDEAIVWPALLVYVAIRNRAEFAATARSAWKGQAA